jgi:hypothetical protein
MTYDYTNLKQKIKHLTGLDKNKLDYVEYAIELLTEEYLAIAKYLGGLDGKKMLCQTVSGRKSLGYDENKIIEIFQERQQAESALNLIDEIIRLTKKKIEFLID